MEVWKYNFSGQGEMMFHVEVFDDWKLDPLQAVSPQLRLRLRSRIIRNDLKPMTRLSEPELATEYGVSRQPVREAFITLANEGLLEIRPQRGTRVKLIDFETVLDGRFVREAVEADIVKKIAKNPTQELISELRRQIDTQMKIAEGDAPEKFIEIDELFHFTLASAAGLRKAWGYLEAIKAQMDRVRFITMEEFPIATLIKQHQQIVEFIEQRTPERAEEAMRKHLSEILQSLPKIQQLYPDYFENSREINP
jgi:DNA-binding GntR family transcriptional regulator